MKSYTLNKVLLKSPTVFLTTRFKDEALAPGQSVLIGRDPLWIAGIMTVGLILFASRFGDLLYWFEQIFLLGIGIAVSASGYCIASLQIGQHMRERTVLWAPIWTTNDVRKAIARVRHASLDGDTNTAIHTDMSE